MRSVLPAAVLAVALVTAAPTVNAQAVADVIGPRAGSWGAEATYGGTSAATLLHFSSPSAAWLVGVAFNVARETADNYNFAGTPTTESRDYGSVNARVGRRWWSGDASARLRPLTGIGLTGGLGSYPFEKAWNAGGYGELGATYFFSPHVSLGASGELSLGYQQNRRSSGVPGSSDQVSRYWLLRGDLARVSAGVYF
jgi:hypothetical protein